MMMMIIIFTTGYYYSIIIIINQSSSSSDEYFLCTPRDDGRTNGGWTGLAERWAAAFESAGWTKNSSPRYLIRGRQPQCSSANVWTEEVEEQDKGGA